MAQNRFRQFCAEDLQILRAALLIASVQLTTPALRKIAGRLQHEANQAWKAGAADPEWTREELSLP